MSFSFNMGRFEEDNASPAISPTESNLGLQNHRNRIQDLGQHFTNSPLSSGSEDSVLQRLKELGVNSFTPSPTSSDDSLLDLGESRNKNQRSSELRLSPNPSSLTDSDSHETPDFPGGCQRQALTAPRDNPPLNLTLSSPVSLEAARVSSLPPSRLSSPSLSFPGFGDKFVSRNHPPESPGATQSRLVAHKTVSPPLPTSKLSHLPLSASNVCDPLDPGGRPQFRRSSEPSHRSLCPKSPPFAPPMSDLRSAGPSISPTSELPHYSCDQICDRASIKKIAQSKSSDFSRYLSPTPSNLPLASSEQPPVTPSSHGSGMPNPSKMATLSLAPPGPSRISPPTAPSSRFPTTPSSPTSKARKETSSPSMNCASMEESSSQSPRAITVSPVANGATISSSLSNSNGNPRPPFLGVIRERQQVLPAQEETPGSPNNDRRAKEENAIRAAGLSSAGQPSPSASPSSVPCTPSSPTNEGRKGKSSTSLNRASMAENSSQSPRASSVSPVANAPIVSTSLASSSGNPRPPFLGVIRERQQVLPCQDENQETPGSPSNDQRDKREKAIRTAGLISPPRQAIQSSSRSSSPPVSPDNHDSKRVGTKEALGHFAENSFRLATHSWGSHTSLIDSPDSPRSPNSDNDATNAEKGLVMHHDQSLSGFASPDLSPSPAYSPRSSSPASQPRRHPPFPPCRTNALGHENASHTTQTRRHRLTTSSQTAKLKLSLGRISPVSPRTQDQELARTKSLGTRENLKRNIPELELRRPPVVDFPHNVDANHLTAAGGTRYGRESGSTDESRLTAQAYSHSSDSARVFRLRETSAGKKRPDDLLAIPALAEDRETSKTVLPSRSMDLPLRRTGSWQEISVSSSSIGSNFAALDQIIRREIEEARKAAQSVVSDPSSHNQRWSDERLHNILQAAASRPANKPSPFTTPPTPSKPLFRSTRDVLKLSSTVLPPVNSVPHTAPPIPQAQPSPVEKPMSSTPQAQPTQAITEVSPAPLPPPLPPPPPPTAQIDPAPPTRPRPPTQPGSLPPTQLAKSAEEVRPQMRLTKAVLDLNGDTQMRRPLSLTEKSVIHLENDEMGQGVAVVVVEEDDCEDEQRCPVVSPTEQSVELHDKARDIFNSAVPTFQDKSKQQIPQAGLGGSHIRKARFEDQDQEEQYERAKGEEEHDIDEIGVLKSVSTAESDVASLDGLPSNLKPRWLEEGAHRDHFMQQLDGIDGQQITQHPPQDLSSNSQRERETKHEQGKPPPESLFSFNFGTWPLSYLWGTSESNEQGGSAVGRQKIPWKNQDDSLALIGCAPVVRQRARPIPTSLVRVTSEPPPPSYAETIHATEVDPRMQAWVEIQYAPRVIPPKDGSYYLGKSKTVVVHEIMRGDWTWCTAWSPEGDRLAVATENHHLAVVDTVSSAVWRVRHDKKMVRPVKTDSTQSIRAIAWGSHFIAIGGTGNFVRILSPIEPYPVLHTIKGTGFVGSLHWKVDSTVLAIGSRLDKAIIVRIGFTDVVVSPGKQIQSELLHTVDCKHWVNCVAFSPGGSCLAVGDASGVLSVFNFVDKPEQPVEVTAITTFTLQDSILAVEWSPDGKWLYAGGEDFHITVIDTNYWEVIHRINRKRWVQCIASSSGGSHLAAGGVSSEISILEVRNGWDPVLAVELKGLVPLSAAWHPKDQYLALTGQNNSILAVETTNARHVKGHHLHSISPILSIEFSPDGRMAVIGNQAGVVTFFSLSGSTFVTAYELVVTLTDRVCIEWSVNGVFVVIGSKDALMIVGQTRKEEQSDNAPPSASGFSVRKVIRDLGEISAVSIDAHSQYVAVSGTHTRILDATVDFAVVREWKSGPCQTNAWSSDGRWLATMGEEKVLTIYDTGKERVDRWRALFSLNCDFVGLSLAWGPVIAGGLLYLAYGGEGKNEITIMEIRTLEGTWETVLRIPRDGAIHDLDWGAHGLLAGAIGNGTVSIVDLAYLQSGVAVNEMDYNWQRQALTCFTEIRRNRGTNCMRTVKWIPSAPGSDSLLAIGGSDGELEIVDLTERRRCRGYVRGLA